MQRRIVLPRSLSHSLFYSAFAYTALAFGLLLAADAMASGSHLVVRGIARIDAHVARSKGKIILRGTVTDDQGAPNPGVKVAVQLTHEGRGPISLAAFGAGAPEACGDAGATHAPMLEGPDRIVLLTDEAARFCVSLTVPTDRYVAHLETRAAGFLDIARIDLPVDLALATVTLRFDPEQALLSLSLDDPSTTVDVVASTEDDGANGAGEGLRLLLANESGASLAEATTDPSGRARFVVPSARLGRTGKGELRVSFAGNLEVGASSHVIEIERRTLVEIDAPDAVLGTLPIGSPESGIILRVVARPACLARGCTGSPSGTVEVRLGDEGTGIGPLIAAAPLENGEARVRATFPTPEAPAQVPLSLRYLPDSPWFQAAHPLSLLQPVSPPSPWNRIALVAASFLVVAWLGVGRFSRGSRAEGSRVSRGPASDDDVGAIEMMRVDPSPSGRWTGRVFDAHEGSPLAAVRLVVERPAFEGAAFVSETESDADGAFVLVLGDTLPGDRLVVEGRLHGRLTMPMPPRGELKIALVARRRALLDRLVSWARTRGRPFDARPDPTPGHVRRAARMGADGADGEGRNAGVTAVREWADAVERAAYAGEAVDAAAEAEIDRLAPNAVPGSARR